MNPSHNTPQIFALSGKKVIPISLAGLTPIGGRGTAGVEIPDLKHRGDYAILAPDGNGIAIHSLRSRGAPAQTIQSGECFVVDDLSLFVLSAFNETANTSADISAVTSILTRLSTEPGAAKPLEDVLSELMKITQLEKGLVITKSLTGSYEILVSRNVQKQDAWLSESLVQHALKERKPVFLKNIVGTQFDVEASLVATGFISLFCWPLLVQGEIHGLILTGSMRPHSGLKEADLKFCEALVSLASMITHFRKKELSLNRMLEELKSQRNDIPLLTADTRLQETCELARKVATSDLSVLIQGETGAGKEVISRWMHDVSDRRSAPFIAVNCSAIPRELLESVLFGHRKGSFTGANADQVGKLEQADRGTLFLDEIGDLPLDLQAKLLRVLQDKCVEPLGSNKPVQLNIRVLSATHKSVKELVRDGKFREDLYYRIAEMTLWIPPLRERPGDIRLLAQQFLSEMADAKNPKQFSPQALAWLTSQPWKGNTRELKSAIKRSTLLCAGEEIEVSHFTRGNEQGPQTLGPASEVSDEMNWLGGETLEAAKQAFITSKVKKALELTRGNRTKAAELLGITPRTLFRYLEELAATSMSQ
jgi:DNA-binding NtrC family response regulator